LAKEIKVFERTHAQVQARELCKVSNRMAHVHRVSHDIVACDTRGPARRHQYGGEHSDGGSLPGTVWTEKREDFTLFDREGQLTDGGEIFELLGEFNRLN
jgi:hypothetical protein